MEVAFSDWTDRFKAYNEYIKALGEYKLKTAQAELQVAQTANIWATIRAKQVVIRQLERDLRAFNRARNRNSKELRRIRDKDTAARLLLKGSRIASSSFTRAWSGYVFFESKAMISAGERLFRINVPKSARNSSNFISTRASGSVVDAPDEIENALQLMQWLKTKRYVPSRGSRAQLAVVKLFQEINLVATKSLEDLKHRMSEIRAETYDAWNFNGIIGVSENSAAKKIEEAGAT